MSAHDDDAAYLTGRMIGGLIDSSHNMLPTLVPQVVARHAASAGAGDVVIYLQDYEQNFLVPLDDANGTWEPLSIDGTVAGRAFRTSTLMETDADGQGVRLFLPLLNGADRTGVLMMTVSAVDARVRLAMTRFASSVTDLIISKGLHTDTFFQARRTSSMTLSAEMQWHLLPSLTVITPQVELAGILEPAYEVGGDAFDYAVNDNVADIAIFDAMGHNLDASMMANLVVGAYRHARRNDVGLAQMYATLDEAVGNQFTAEQFATVLLAQLHLDTGELMWVNAGHPSPMLFRGHSFVRYLQSVTTTLPVGFGGANPFITTEGLQPGDRVVFYTDGVVEEILDGEQFGEDRLIETLSGHFANQLPLAEVVRRISHDLMRQRGGSTSDDATLVVMEWVGGDT